MIPILVSQLKGPVDVEVIGTSSKCPSSAKISKLLQLARYKHYSFTRRPVTLLRWWASVSATSCLANRERDRRRGGEMFTICNAFVEILASARFVKERKKENQSCFFHLTSNRCIFSDAISISQCALNQCETATDAPRRCCD